MALRYTLSKDERLKREQHIETLFRTGKAFSVFPVRVLWHLVPLAEGEQFTTRAGFSVPKKKFKHATDRNRIKRLLRESWRLQKHTLLTGIPEGQQLQLFLIFTDTSLPEYLKVKEATAKAIDRLLIALNDLAKPVSL